MLDTDCMYEDDYTLTPQGLAEAMRVVREKLADEAIWYALTLYRAKAYAIWDLKAVEFWANVALSLEHTIREADDRPWVFYRYWIDGD